MKFYICQNDHNEITPAMSFKRTLTLNAISNESALIHFASGNLVHIKISCRFVYLGQNDRHVIHTGFSFLSPKFM